MTYTSSKPVTGLLLGLLAILPMSCGSDRTVVLPSQPQPPVAGPSIDASTAPFEDLAELNIVSEVVGVTIKSPPVVKFKFETDKGIPIVGLVPYWQASNRFIRFTLTKLVKGTNGDPDSWVAYVRDAGEPDYDTGSSLVDHGDGTYSFTFETDVTNVPGVKYEPALTHRVAGQIGRYSTVPLQEQNVWLDFVPNGKPVTHTRNIAVMDSCNECHTDLVFHGRRFEVEYCVQCHNPDLAEGEGDFSFMIHRIHAAGEFNHILDRSGQPLSFAEVTYPQDLTNCRKCHNVDDAETPEADHWRTVPNMTACSGCHDNFGPNAKNQHSSPIVQVDNSACSTCHPKRVITEVHTTPNVTPNNPELLPGQRHITYELIDATVDGSNNVTIQFKILSDGTALDITNLPADLKDASGEPFRYPGLLLAYAMEQLPITDPSDYNNMGNRSAQPLSHGLDDFAPIATNSIGMVAFDSATGIMTATITDGPAQFPMTATLRAVGLQGYLQQDLDGDGSADVSLHTPSAVVAVTGDKVRRGIVDNTSCANCHESFEGHGGNRVYNMAICTLCHVPNLSSSGRTIDPNNISSSVSAALGNNPLVYPEDAQNFRDLVHGIHSEGFRTRAFEHVRGGRQGYYDWSEVTFPRGASTSDCMLCHKPGSYKLPLDPNLLPTIVRTTAVANGQDPDLATVEGAFQSVPNDTDWVNTPMASSCFYCHTDTASYAHMMTNGGLLSVPPFAPGGPWTNRTGLVNNLESCSICHGAGRPQDVEVVHNR